MQLHDTATPESRLAEPLTGESLVRTKPEPAATGGRRASAGAVALSGEQITAALFFWSCLPQKGADPGSALVGDDLAAIVAVNGTEAVGSAAGYLDETAVALPVLTERLAWCRRAAAALTGARALVVAL